MRSLCILVYSFMLTAHNTYVYIMYLKKLSLKNYVGETCHLTNYMPKFVLIISISLIR